MEALSNSAARSAGSPLGERAFAVLWLATVVSNTGTWMHEVGAGWLMAELKPSPASVSLVQAATTLPVFLFALLAGVLADAFDRRRILLLVNALMAVTALLLAWLAHSGRVTPTGLVVLTFLLGTGAAFIAPAWQAIVPSLVPRSQITAAVALNSMGINISRAIGPALAGALIVAVGVSAPFVLNAVSFAVVIAALAWWRGEPAVSSPLAREPLGPALIGGLRHVRNNPWLLATLARAVAFFAFASAYWALLPLIARVRLAGEAGLYGLLVALIGAGAVTGALLLPRLKRRWTANRRVAAGSLGTAAALLVFAALASPPAAMVAAFVAGMSWIVVLATLNAAAQLSLPGWVRARGLSVFITLFFGAMAGGSLVWGQVAERFGIEAALAIAALGAILLLPLTARVRLPAGAGPDHTPALHWPTPVSHVNADNGRGPVMVQISYQVPAARQAAFITAIHELARSRRRLGVSGWYLMQDAADAERFIETFFESTWQSHLRHHERVSEADRRVQEAVHGYLVPGTEPQVTHWIAVVNGRKP